MAKKKQTPLTVEVFFEEVMPAIEEMLDRKIDGVKDYVMDYKVETIGEIQALREQVTVTLHQYGKTSKRLDRVVRKIKLPPIDLLCPRRESNLELALRRGLLYPFNYEGN